MTTVNIVTGSMLKGLREAGCRITTICKCKGYAWKVAVVRTDYDYAVFSRHFKNVHIRNCS